ncbi:MAG: hypothetical protein IPH76_16860 [Xanthomonadales bacterium]|nr:hypothetical protein [Xanthomonadales bacterium]
MTWLDRLKKTEMPGRGTDKTDRTPKRPLLSVLAVADPGTFEKSPGRAVVRFRFAADPPNAWATCLGAPSESAESVRAGLRAKWPNVMFKDGEP